MVMTLRRRLMASTIFVASVAASPSFAQTTPAEAVKEAAAADGAGEIIVTGSRIQRPDLETASPVNVVGQQEIQLRQANTAEELLRDLPSVRPSIGPGVNNGSDGSASVDLRGIGTNRTLVLLDGHRIVPFGLDGVTDLNTIPVALVERVDVVTGGASTVYGADAVAGVVNFVTKRDFTGIDLSGNYKISERGDAARYRLDLLVGAEASDGRGNVVLGIGYQKSDPLAHTSRKISRIPIGSATGQFLGSQGSVPTIVTSPGNAALGIGASTLGATFDPATGLLRPAVAADTFNTNIGTFFQTELDRFNVYAAGHYEVSDHLEVYSSGQFTRSQVNIQLASSATFNNTFQLALNNPYLPTGVRNQLCGAFDTNAAVSGIQPISAANCAAAAAVQGGPGTPGYQEIPVIAQRRFTEYGPRGNPVTSNQFQVVVGARGDIVSGFRYDVSAQYGETSQVQRRERWGSASKVQQALRAYRTPTGTIRCADLSNNCVPLNLFGPEGSITADQLGFIGLDAIIQRTTKLSVVNASVSGDLFTSPLADSAVAFSVGGEYRNISARSNPDGPSQIQSEVLGTGARTPPDFGRYDVKEVFGEIIVPLIADKPFFYKLTAEAGVRYSDYSTTDTSTTWKAGGSYEPVEGIKFRGMYQRAVRSPNILELFQSPVQSLSNQLIDPCQGALPVGNAALTALCVGTGAPSGTIGSIPTPSSSQINATTAGNRNLDVERASTYTLGGVFTPAFLPGFAVTVDYFNIKVKDAITSPAQGDILNGCYSTALNPGQTLNAFCALIGRNPLNGSLNGAGDTPGVILSTSNLGVIETAGVDFGVSYRAPLAFVGLETASLGLAFNGTYLDYYHFQANPNAINRDCTGNYSVNCTNPRAKFRSNARVTYSQGMFDISLQWQHVSSVKLEPFLATAVQPLSTPQAGGPNPSGVLDAFEKIKAYDYFDLALRAVVSDNLEFSLTVDNLFDKAPPLVGANVGGTAFNSGNTFPTIYDPIGRAYTFGARVKF